MSGVVFRVWATHAHPVFGTDTFDNWTESMQRGDNGFSYTDFRDATIGDEHRYLDCRGDPKLSRTGRIRRLIMRTEFSASDLITEYVRLDAPGDLRVTLWC